MAQITQEDVANFGMLAHQHFIHPSTSWQEVSESNPFPREGSGVEFLVRNDNQGGVLSLVYWDRTHNCFKTKGGVSFEANMGTHFMLIPVK